MGIPIGKLQLYTACAAVPPQYLLPMHIDFGTNNRELLADPLYLGLRQPRVPAAELDAFIEEFVEAVQDVFPDCCIHFEDWAGVDAMRLLARYRDRVCCYNDDIQGTAAWPWPGCSARCGSPAASWRDQRILFLGAGSAAIGIADLIASAMTLEGLTEEPGPVADFAVRRQRPDRAEPHRSVTISRSRYAHPHAPSRDFVAVIESLRPTAIIGVSTKGKAFNQAVIEAMARLNRRPIIFALSNPTDHAECTAEEAYRWSEGRALYAAGVPFPPVQYGGKTLVPGQGNNLYIFPAMGLAVYATRARRVTDEMFVAAAAGVAEQVTQAELDSGLLYPPQSQILKTEIKTARRVCEVIFDRGLAGVERPRDLDAFVASQLYKPEYPEGE